MYFIRLHFQTPTTNKNTENHVEYKTECKGYMNHDNVKAKILLREMKR